MEIIDYRVRSTVPLLMHSPAGMAAGPSGVGRKTIPSPSDEAEAAAYRLPDRQLYMPTIAFRAAILNACKGRRIGRHAARGMMSSSLFVTGDVVALFDPSDAPAKPLYDYEVDVRRCVVQRQGVMRARPLVREWQGCIEFEFDADFLKRDWITEMFALAGKTVGVGDYRPERTGPYGRFVVEEI